MAEPIRGEAKGAVLEMTLDCPPANAIDLSVSRALYSAFVRLRDDAGLRVGSSRPRHRRSFAPGWPADGATSPLAEVLPQGRSGDPERHPSPAVEQQPAHL